MRNDRTNETSAEELQAAQLLEFTNDTVLLAQQMFVMRFYSDERQTS